jgi:hypothetical protein
MQHVRPHSCRPQTLAGGRLRAARGGASGTSHQPRKTQVVSAAPLKSTGAWSHPCKRHAPSNVCIQRTSVLCLQPRVDHPPAPVPICAATTPAEQGAAWVWQCGLHSTVQASPHGKPLPQQFPAALAAWSSQLLTPPARVAKALAAVGPANLLAPCLPARIPLLNMHTYTLTACTCTHTHTSVRTILPGPCFAAATQLHTPAQPHPLQLPTPGRAQSGAHSTLLAALASCPCPHPAQACPAARASCCAAQGQAEAPCLPLPLPKITQARAPAQAGPPYLYLPAADAAGCSFATIVAPAGPRRCHEAPDTPMWPAHMVHHCRSPHPCAPALCYAVHPQPHTRRTSRLIWVLPPPLGAWSRRSYGRMASSRGAWTAQQATLCRRRLHTTAFCAQPASIHPAVPRQPTCSMQEHAAGKGPHTAVLPSWLRPVLQPPVRGTCSLHAHASS